MTARKPLIAGNWKMNLNHYEAIQVVQKFVFALPKEYYESVDVAFIPPFTDIRSVQTLVDGDKLEITYGGQDVSQHTSGAYTGEVSGAMLKKLGCTWGHHWPLRASPVPRRDRRNRSSQGSRSTG